MIERHLALHRRATARASVLDALGRRGAASSSRSCRRITSACWPASKRAQEQGLGGDEAIMAAFEENARDLARVGGN